MSAFSSSSLDRKLKELNNSAQSIQQTSSWFLHHHKHCHIYITAWRREMTSSSQDRKLTLLYLANDVVQNGRKKYPDVVSGFGSVMESVFQDLVDDKAIGSKTKASISRIVRIWHERSVFDKLASCCDRMRPLQAELERIWSAASGDEASLARKSSGSTPPVKTESSSVTTEASGQGSEFSCLLDKRDPDTIQSIKAAVKINSANDEDLNDLLQADEEKPESTKVPDSDELIKALQDLEHAASADADVRGKIAKLPTSVSETSQLESIKSVAEAEILATEVEETKALLSDYNSRLATELEDRKKFNAILQAFLRHQKQVEAETEERLEVYREKLEQIDQVRDQLISHVESLPDLSADVTLSTLTPLPSAGDLFLK